ncbi:unnamed protein product, partial [Didymodactylos carnosus]
QGLDYFSADGSTAFETLVKLCDDPLLLGIPSHLIDKLRCALHQCRNYLITDYKSHISQESTVPDRCTVFALSDLKEKQWQQKCEHHHNDQCFLLDESIQKLRSLIENQQIPDTQRSRFIYRIEHNYDLIKQWKAHLLRSVHQDDARYDVLENLNAKSVLLYMDWAMKFLPMKYREAQREFFGKRGLSWHLTYVIRTHPPSSPFSTLLSSSTTSPASDQQLFEHKTYCHIFDNCKQNGKTVVSILRDVLLRLKSSNPEIEFACIRVDFSDPQAGKEPCDRMAATIKCNIRRYVDEKHNCTNSQEFVVAARSTKYLSIYQSLIPSNPITASNRKLEWTGI